MILDAWQEPALTTVAARANPFQLLVALDASGSAQGDVFLDDGETLQVGVNATRVSFTAAGNTLKSAVAAAAYPVTPPLNTVRVLGVLTTVSTVTLNDQTVPTAQWQYDATAAVLTVRQLGQGMANAFVLTWH